MAGAARSVGPGFDASTTMTPRRRASPPVKANLQTPGSRPCPHFGQGRLRLSPQPLAGAIQGVAPRDPWTSTPPLKGSLRAISWKHHARRWHDERSDRTRMARRRRKRRWHGGGARTAAGGTGKGPARARPRSVAGGHTQAARISLLGWRGGTAARSRKSPPACGSSNGRAAGCRNLSTPATTSAGCRHVDVTAKESMPRGDACAVPRAAPEPRSPAPRLHAPHVPPAPESRIFTKERRRS